MQILAGQKLAAKRATRKSPHGMMRPDLDADGAAAEQRQPSANEPIQLLCRSWRLLTTAHEPTASASASPSLPRATVSSDEAISSGALGDLARAATGGAGVRAATV